MKKPTNSSWLLVVIAMASSACSSVSDVVPVTVPIAFAEAVRAQGVQWPDRVLQPIIKVVETLFEALSATLVPNQVKFKKTTISSCRRDPESFANGHGGKDSK